MNLSDEAKSALINARAGGSPVCAKATVLVELRSEGLLSKRQGLTRRGSIERERLLAEAEDKAFGA